MLELGKSYLKSNRKHILSMPNKNYNLFPEVDKYEEFSLKAGNIHEIYYEICGNPNGKPVVFLHGGPGSGCNPTQRRFFDPNYYRIILIDQRGCGRSKPQGSTEQNTTDDLVNDINAIRKALNIDKWLVFGGSWGSTLALAYAIKYPSHVTGLILRGVFLSRPSELDWFLGQVQMFFPEPWQILCNYLLEDKRDSPLKAYKDLVFSTDTKVSIPAAIRWNTFEGSIMSLLPRAPCTTGDVNGEIELARARVQIHYIENNCFVGHRDLLAEANIKLANIPTHIIQGRYDMVCPPISAWELSRAMPHASFKIVDDAGHSAMETGITSALVEATEKFKAFN